MNCATPAQKQRLVIWLVWLLVMIVAWQQPCLGSAMPERLASDAVTVVLTSIPARELFPWWPCWRWRKWALAAHQRWQRARRTAALAAGWARLALAGTLKLATVVDWLTRQQLHRQLGALPVLYAVLEVLQVRQIIQRICPQTRVVDHGTVALVLILNRLLAPRPLQQIADWYAHTVLVYKLGVPAGRFNDDRLARTLDALAPHCRDIWLAVVSRALECYDIDLRMIFYDLTAFVAHGAYADSQLVDFGFAHNTPSNKRKFKVGVAAAADGNIPLNYQGWAGHTADKATVEANLAQLSAVLAAHGWAPSQVLLVGDCANLDERLAVLYDQHQIYYLSKVPLVKKVHRALVSDVSEADFYHQPLTERALPATYWGVPVRVPFEHAGRRVQHRGLVVLSASMRTAWGQTRQKQVAALEAALMAVQVKTKRGACKYRTAQEVRDRARRQVAASPVGEFISFSVTGEAGAIQLQWQVRQERLVEAMQQDGRYLLVTNHPTLSPQEMFQRYCQKDGVEKDFTVCKQDVKVSPIYLHKDQRIQAMLLLNMLALLTYTILERQLRHGGLQLTTRRLIQQLESLCVIETHCWDGSVLLQLTPLSREQQQLVRCLADIVPLRRTARISQLIPDPTHGPPWLLLPGC